MTDTVFLVAGGTGGHVFPALALAESLNKRGIKTEFIGDDRTETYYKKNNITAHINVAGRVDAGVWGKIKGVFGIGIGVLQALDLYREHQPKAVIGFGGYPSFPAVLAAQILKIPTYLHEQNAVFGRANRMLAKRAAGVATSFKNTLMIPSDIVEKVTYTGNPIRAAVIANDAPYVPAGDKFNLLVFGGSQGSRIFRTLPQAVEKLAPDLRARLVVTQQCRNEDRDEVANAYNKIAVTARLEVFFDDMPSLYPKTHLVMARAGASTVVEIAALGRPAIFVPLASSLDGDQAQNAKALADNGAAWILAEKDFTPDNIAARLTEAMRNPQDLAVAAEASRKLGQPKAADNLADLVLRTA